MATKVPLLKEGCLYKRQRGKSASNDLRRLKFQQRHMRLDENTLGYYEDRKKDVCKGYFPVNRIRIVETVPEQTFKKQFCFQIGDFNEIMYFKARSEIERIDWMEAIRVACTLNDNEMYGYYHTGAYGLIDGISWSCCKDDNKDSPGCKKVLSSSEPPSWHRSQLSLISVSSLRQQQLEGIPLESPTSMPEAYMHPISCYSNDLQLDDEVVQDEIYRETSSYVQQTELEDMEKKATDRSDNTMSIDSGLDVASRFSSRSVSRASIISTNFQGKEEQKILAANFKQNTASWHNLNQAQPHEIPHIYEESQTDDDEMQYSLLRSKLLEHVKKVKGLISLSSSSHLQLTHDLNPWKLLDILIIPESHSEITTIVFQGASTLITVSKEGYVHVVDVSAKIRRDPEYASSTSVGTVDVWKNYLVIGFPNVQIIDLDTQERRELGISIEHEASEVEYPHYVSFTPEGQLISCQSSSNCIYVWPAVDILWPALPDHESTITSESFFTINDVQEIQSLTVSPDPAHSLVAMIVLKSSKGRAVQVYDYKTKDLTLELEVKEMTSSSPAALVFHPNAKVIAIGNGASLELYDILKRSYQFKSDNFAKDDGYITSLCFHPTGSHLTIGFDTGEAKSFEGLPSSPHLIASLSKPETRSPVSASAISYSKDCCVLAVGYGNGIVQLWQVLQHDYDSLALLREGELTVTQNGARFISPDDGYSISVPSGAIANGSTITLRHGVIPHGAFHDFRFPQGVYPVSPIISLQSTTQLELFKPFDVALPHFINCETPEDCMKLAVFKAYHTIHGNEVTSGYQFEPTPNESLSLYSHRSKESNQVVPYASYSSDCCCLLCIGTYTSYDADKAMFSLMEAKQKQSPTEKELTIHYCLPCNLPTCIKAVKEQFPEDYYDLTQSVIMFSVDDDPTISIEFERNLSGWICSLQGSDKIYKKDLYFWDYPSCQALTTMCETRQYPPRFILNIDGQRATKSTMMRVLFHGAEEYFKWNIPFSDVTLGDTLGIGCLPSSGRLEPFRPVAGMISSSNHPFQSAMSEFTDVSPAKLAFYLFSRNVIAYVDYEQTNMKLSESSDPGYDPEELNVTLLAKVYRVLKENPQKIDAVCSALERFKDKKDTIQKLASDSKIYMKQSLLGSTESNACDGSQSTIVDHENLTGDAELSNLEPAVLSKEIFLESSDNSPEDDIKFECIDLSFEAEEKTQVPFLYSHLLTCDNNGIEFSIAEHDITLRIPKGAVSAGTTIHLEIGVAMYGPFNFVKTRPISPIFWLCIREDAHLQKPLQIILPHFLPGLTSENSHLYGVNFAKASHHKSSAAEQVAYDFSKCETKPYFASSGFRHYGILQTKHCCFYCIEVKFTPELAHKADYYLVQIEFSSNPKYEIHYCAIYFLDTCIRALEEQFPHEEGYDIQYHKFNFKEYSDDPCLEIIVPPISESYLIGMVPTEPKIRFSHIDFWTKDYGSLKLMHRNKIYPYRVILTVTMKESQFVLPIKFHGCSTDSQLDRNLTFPLGSAPPLARSNTSSSTSDFHSYFIICGKPNMKDAFKILLPLAQDWKTIGALLGLEEHDIDRIKRDEGGVRDCLHKTVSEWLKQLQPVPTWKDLADAVEEIDQGKATEIRGKCIDP